MQTADIQKHFSVNHSSARTLTSQLEKRIARFIEEHEDGTLLPPEEMLAKLLGVSRVTVRNALKPFLEKNQIVREVRRGTRIRKSVPFRESAEPLDPLALGMVWRRVPQKTLRLLSYETLPLQESFWNRIVREYSAKNPGTQIKIVSMKSGMLSRNLSELLQEKQIDLFLYSHSYSEMLPELAHPLPEDLRIQMTGPEYLSAAEAFRENPAYHYLLPLNFSTGVIAWNGALAARIGLKDIRRRLEKGKLLELILEAAPLLPDTCHAAGHAWDLLALAGCPESSSEIQQLEKRLLQLEPVLKTPRACIVSPTHSLEELIRKFHDGRLLFFPTLLNTIFARGIPDVPFQMCPLHPEEGCRNLIMSLDLAISRFSGATEESEKFMKFLISPQIQKWIATIKRAAPIRRENFYDFMKQEFQYLPEQADHWLREHKLFRSQFLRGENYHRFLTFDCRSELEDIAAGRFSAEKAASLLRVKYNSQLTTLKEEAM